MILLIDNYDSFTGNLLHLIQMSGRSCCLLANDTFTADEAEQWGCSAIVFSPGPRRPADAGVMGELIHRLHTRVPMLGICLGHQAIGEYFGARLLRARQPMHGKTSPIFHNAHPVFSGIAHPFAAMRYHSLILEDIPQALEIMAQTEDGECMAIRHREYPLVGLQFHPESVLTPDGPKIVDNWFRMHQL